MKLVLENNEWREYKEGDKNYLQIDGFLKQKLDNILYIQKKNFDAVFMIVGKEGSGKSTLAFICGDYLTKKRLTINNLVAGSDDALSKLEHMPDESLLICDEAELLFSSRETMSKEQRQLTRVMKVIRQKRMILILVTPTYFDLSKYIAVDRPRFLLRCYTNSKLDRGFFNYWGEKKLNKLYTEGKKRNNSYNKPKAQFNGTFTDYKTSFDAEYRASIKTTSLKEAFVKKTDAREEKRKRLEKEFIEKRNKIILGLRKRYPETKISTLAEVFDLEASSIYTILNANELENRPLQS